MTPQEIHEYCAAKWGAWEDVAAYIGRSGWDTLDTGGGIPDDELRETIDRSYELVVAGLPKRYREPPEEQSS